MTDKQSKQDEIRAHRATEGREREWRRKEKEAALKAKKMEQELKQERLFQNQQKQANIAQEASFLRQEFQKGIKKQMIQQGMYCFIQPIYSCDG